MDADVYPSECRFIAQGKEEWSNTESETGWTRYLSTQLVIIVQQFRYMGEDMTDDTEPIIMEGFRCR